MKKRFGILLKEYRTVFILKALDLFSMFKPLFIGVIKSFSER